MLIVAARNAALDRDILGVGLRERDLGDGYARLEGLTFATVLVDLAALAAHHREDFVALFAARSHPSAAARSWWYARYGPVKEDLMDPSSLEDFQAMEREFLESFPPEVRLAGLPPEARLADLSDAEAVLAMPDGVLTVLPDEYIATLPDAVRERVLRCRAARAR